MRTQRREFMAVMGEREQGIVWAILETLDQVDGQPILETILHGAVNLKLTERALLSEFSCALKFCENRAWVIGVRTRLGNVKWSLTAVGKAALLDA